MATDVGALFLAGSGAGFGVTITLWPFGDVAQKTTFTGVAVRDGEEGTREVHGDGVAIDERHEGKVVRASVIVECATSVAIQDAPDTIRPDLIKLPDDDRVYTIKRITSRDDDMMAFLAVHATKVSERAKARRG